MFRTYVIAAVAAFTVAQASAQSLWGNTTVGMTVDEVKSVVPEAVPDSSGSRGTDGSESKLMTAQFEVAKVDLAAKFYFKDAKLVMVILRSVNPEPPYLLSGTFNTMLGALRGKYGAETILDRTKNSFGDVRIAKWVSGGTQIKLTMFAMGDSPTSISVVYTGEAGANNSKL